MFFYHLLRIYSGRKTGFKISDEVWKPLAHELAWESQPDFFSAPRCIHLIVSCPPTWEYTGFCVWNTWAEAKRVWLGWFLQTVGFADSFHSMIITTLFFLLFASAEKSRVLLGKKCKCSMLKYFTEEMLFFSGMISCGTKPEGDLRRCNIT